MSTLHEAEVTIGRQHQDAQLRDSHNPTALGQCWALPKSSVPSRPGRFSLPWACIHGAVGVGVRATFCKMRKRMHIFVFTPSSDAGAGMPRVTEAPSKAQPRGVLTCSKRKSSGQLTKWPDVRCLGSTENMFIEKQF